MGRKIDILAFAAHPDDAELGCSGTLLRMAAQGRTTGIVDLTQGELGTRGSVELRAKEAAAAAEILGLTVRENLKLQDGFLQNTPEMRLEVIRAIRKYQPEVMLINAPADRHPDHGNASTLAAESAFLAGLSKIETFDEEAQLQSPWRPKKVWRYIQDQLLMPDFVVDISPYFETKLSSILAFGSQFYNPHSKEPETYISNQDFLHSVEARARQMGHLIGKSFGEGFLSVQPLRVDDLMAHL